jgi:hypothetical protein
VDIEHMTYYQQLVMNAEAAMSRHPRSTIIMDAQSFEIISSGCDARQVARDAETAVSQGRTPVVMQKPRHPENWVLAQR